jgi:hypothetical protein
MHSTVQVQAPLQLQATYCSLQQQLSNSNSTEKGMVTTAKKCCLPPLLSLALPIPLLGPSLLLSIHHYTPPAPPTALPPFQGVTRLRQQLLDSKQSHVQSTLLVCC